MQNVLLKLSTTSVHSTTDRVSRTGVPARGRQKVMTSRALLTLGALLALVVSVVAQAGEFTLQSHWTCCGLSLMPIAPALVQAATALLQLRRHHSSSCWTL